MWNACRAGREGKGTRGMVSEKKGNGWLPTRFCARSMRLLQSEVHGGSSS